jgi:hypothetical protein
MENTSPAWQDTLSLGLNSAVEQFSAFLPRIIGALIVFFVGILVARFVRRLVVKTLEALRVSQVIEKTPMELFLKNAEVGQKLEDLIGGLFYWLFLFVVLHTSVSLLGLTPLSDVMDKILSYLPHIFSAFLIFLFGVLLAGVVESVVKGAMRSIDSYSARLFAKIASYAVVAIAGLAAVAELGIASEFIRILFFGVIFAFSLGAALALGLGGQHLIKTILEDWYKRTRAAGKK